MMHKSKKQALEAAGYRVGDVGDFLDLTDSERRLVELRLWLSDAIRRKRKGGHLTQKDVALKIGSTQARIAKIEAGDRDVSLDQSFRAFFAVEGSLDELVGVHPVKATNRTYATARKPSLAAKRSLPKTIVSHESKAPRRSRAPKSKV